MERGAGHDQAVEEGDRGADVMAGSAAEEVVCSGTVEVEHRVVAAIRHWEYQRPIRGLDTDVSDEACVEDVADGSLLVVGAVSHSTDLGPW